MSELEHKKLSAYVIGLAIGDGNLSNPNGRATRLRITCCSFYPNLIGKVQSSLQQLFPKNKVSIVKREGNCVDVSCYSNQLEGMLGWKVGLGSKFKQDVIIPDWVLKNDEYSIECLRGLLETDGSVYVDRGYKMVNFTTVIQKLADQVTQIIEKMGYVPHVYKIDKGTRTKYTVRVSKKCSEFIELVNFYKN